MPDIRVGSICLILPLFSADKPIRDLCRCGGKGTLPRAIALPRVSRKAPSFRGDNTMKRTTSTYLACAAIAVAVAGWGGMTGAARAQGCATCGGAAPGIDSGTPCGACDSCGSCATCPTCGHPLLAVPLLPIRFVLNALGDVFRCSGCGCETYYGDDWCCGRRGGCCEPCDTCGNYVGGCGRCGPGGLRAFLFGDGTVRGAAVSDEPLAGGMVSNGDMAIDNHPAYNVARTGGTCPVCGHSYANWASAPRGNAVSAGSSANHGYAATASVNARYNSGNSTASYRGNSSSNGAANYSSNGNYPAVRASYTSTGRAPSPQVDLSTLPPGRFSPKVISVTDEVVSPANAATADAQAARPLGTTTR